MSMRTVLATPKKKNVADGLFDTTQHTDKQLRHFKYESAGFIVSLLASNLFIDQVRLRHWLNLYNT